MEFFDRLRGRSKVPAADKKLLDENLLNEKLLTALRKDPDVQAELQRRETKQSQDAADQVRRLRLEVRDLDRAASAAEAQEEGMFNMEVATISAAQDRLARLNHDREARRAQHTRAVTERAERIKALGSPVLQACRDEAQQWIEAAKDLQVGWQDRPELDAYMNALLSVRERAELAMVWGGDEDDQAIVARLWARVPRCPAQSGHAVVHPKPFDFAAYVAMRGPFNPPTGQNP